MSDLAQVLLLPPPQPPQRLTVPQGLSTRNAADLTVNADAANGGGNAQARRFRFRVYEGGSSGETSTQYDGARVGAPVGSGRISLVSNDAGSADGADRKTSGGRRAGDSPRFFSEASSAFLAQSIAQEQLGEGLHNPPIQAATVAYTRAGTALTSRASAGISITA